MIKNICCIGAGYVGGPTMAVIALKCPHIKITVIDSNPKRIDAWNGPFEYLPIYEPGLADIIKKTRGENLFFSVEKEDSIKKAEMIFMAVNTPTKTEGEGAGMAADLKYIVSCAEDIAKYSDSDKIIVEKSTVPIKTAEKIDQILKNYGEDIKFEILSNPEFLAEGTAINDMYYPDRVLIGGNETKRGQRAVKELVNIYSNWVPKEKIITTNVWSSELSKLASNAMLAQRISSINSFSALCEKTGADIEELSKAIGMDHRIGPKFLKASVGFGGSCFQKDILNLVYLCNFYGLEQVAKYWYHVVKINDYQKERIVNKAINEVKFLKREKKIALLGWAFKANTNDTRHSPSIDVFKKLFLENFHINIFDPKVKKEQILDDIEFSDSDKIKIFNSIEDAIQKVSGIIILTEWEEFKNFDWDILINEIHTPFILDGRNILNENMLNSKIKLLRLDK